MKHDANITTLETIAELHFLISFHTLNFIKCDILGSHRGEDYEDTEALKMETVCFSETFVSTYASHPKRNTSKYKHDGCASF
jgi:hypothetical protein